MEPSLIITGVMSLLTPLLVKAGEKAAETIGEKLAEKTVEKSFWKKIKSIFIVEEEKQVIEAIENKPIADSEEVAMIEDKLTKEVINNPQFAKELKASLNITPANEFSATEKIKSIQRLQKEIKNLEKQMERAGIATSGDYKNKIELQQEKLEYQISTLLEILQN